MYIVNKYLLKRQETNFLASKKTMNKLLQSPFSVVVAPAPWKTVLVTTHFTGSHHSLQ